MKYNVALLAADIRDELGKLEKLSLEFIRIEQLLNLPAEDIGFFEKAATGYFLHSFYNGCENIFRSIARFFENDLGPQTWHRDLLKRMQLSIPGYRPHVIDDNLFILLDELRAFRHIYRHCYSFELNWEREKQIACRYQTAWKMIKIQIEEFLKSLERIESSE